MSRRLIAILLTIYAIAFAFGALTAVRWPSIVMVMGWIVQDDVANGLKDVNWRELGIAHGAAYLFAAVGYYAAGATSRAQGRRRRLVYFRSVFLHSVGLPRALRRAMVAGPERW